MSAIRKLLVYLLISITIALFWFAVVACWLGSNTGMVVGGVAFLVSVGSLSACNMAGRSWKE